MVEDALSHVVYQVFLVQKGLLAVDILMVQSEPIYHLDQLVLDEFVPVELVSHVLDGQLDHPMNKQGVDGG